MKNVEDLKYYLIPTYSDRFSINGVKFEQMIDKAYPMIYDLNMEKENNIHSVIFNPKSLLEVQSKIEKIFDELYIPQYIIAVDENKKLHELITGAKIECVNDRFILLYHSSYETVKSYFNRINYAYRFANFYSDYIMSCEDILDKPRGLHM